MGIPSRALFTHPHDPRQQNIWSAYLIQLRNISGGFYWEYLMCGDGSLFTVWLCRCILLAIVE